MKSTLRCFLIACCCAMGCAPHIQPTSTTKRKPSGTVADSATVVMKDSVIVYETPYLAYQKNWLSELKGTWTMDSMWRQVKLPVELLSGVEITINDSSFTGRAPCNNIFGMLTIKGAGIRFSEIGATKMTCPQIAQETALLQLLSNTVSTYSVASNRLLLRNGGGMVVFTASRK